MREISVHTYHDYGISDPGLIRAQLIADGVLRPVGDGTTPPLPRNESVLRIDVAGRAAAVRRIRKPLRREQDFRQDRDFAQLITAAGRRGR